MQEDINEIMGITNLSSKVTDAQQDSSDLPKVAFALSLISIPVGIGLLLMVHFDPSSLNPIIGILKPLAYYGTLLIATLAFLLGGIALFIKTPSKKYAVLAMIISVLFVLVFYAIGFVLLMVNFQW